MKREPLPAMFRKETQDACIAISDTYATIVAKRDPAAANKALKDLSNTIDTTTYPALAVCALHIVYAYAVNPGLVDETNRDITRHGARIISSALWLPRHINSQKDVPEVENVRGAAYLMANNLVLDKESVRCVPAGLVLKSCLMRASKQLEQNQNKLELAALAAENFPRASDREHLAMVARDQAERITAEKRFIKPRDPKTDQDIAYYRDLSNAFLHPVVG